MTGHLSDEQFSELLYGDCPSNNPFNATRHLLACGECQAELERVRAALDDFADLGHRWSEQRASTSIATPSILVRNWQSVSSGAAAAAVLALAVLFAVNQERKTPEIPAATSQRTDFASEVAADDRLMIAIDNEIRWQTQSPVSTQDLGDLGTSPKMRHSSSLHRLTN
jgi:hypothetical protein